MEYDKKNIFFKILTKEVKTEFILETDDAASFNDINPLAKIHVLVIPKGEYIDSFDFFSNASEKEIIGFWDTVKKTISILDISNNFKLKSNTGIESGQVIPHFHVHIMSNKKTTN